MTSRERILAYLSGQKTDRAPFIISWGPWAETLRRWRSEGMKHDEDWYHLFGFDPYYVEAPVNLGICPPYELEVLDDEGQTIVFRDGDGVIKRDKKQGTTMPQFLQYPVKDRRTWEEHKWRFDPDTKERFSADWHARIRELGDSGAMVVVNSTYPYGFFGGPRTMMGAEAALVACALDPELIDDINSHIFALWYKLLSRVFEEIRIDKVAFWEDMACKHGSLISPAMFRRFLSPYYSKLSELARRHGVQMVSVDSDGFMHELTGLFIEAGVNTIYPYEVQAGNDIGLLLERHRDLWALGGMDKRAMSKNNNAMDAEIARASSVMKHGRYIPFPDHELPSDISWENYQYFVWRWKEMVFAS